MDGAQTDVDEMAEEGFSHGPPRSIMRTVVQALAVAAVVALGIAMFMVGRAQSDDPADHDGRAPIICTPGDPGCIYGETIHEHADFALLINGKRWDFGQDKYVSDEDHELSPYVHIHHPRHTVVHVHKEHVTWEVFLATLGFELRDPTLIGVEASSMKLDTGEVLQDGHGGGFKFFVNGVQVEGIGNLEIRSMQRVLISFGPETAEEARAQLGMVTDEACIPGGLCPERGSGAGEHGEPEPCSGQGVCTGSR